LLRQRNVYERYEGIDWVAVHHEHPAVANLSLTGAGYELLDDAINNLIAAEVTTVVAAGNSNTNACDFSPRREFQTR
jgi:serine protease